MNTAKTISQLINDFVESRDITDRSRKAYRIALHRFFRYLVDHSRPATKPEAGDIFRFKDWLLRNRSPYTGNLYLSALRQFFKWTAKQNYWPNIAENLRPIKLPDTFAKRALCVEEIKQLIGSIDQTRYVGKRDATIIALMFENGLRAVELSRLDVQDFKNKTLSILGKGFQYRVVVPVSDHAAEQLEQLIHHRPLTANDPIFTSHWTHWGEVTRLTAADISQIISKRLKAAGLKDKQTTGHSLRHSGATELLRQTNDIYSVSKFLRHRSVKATEVYLRHSGQSIADQQKPQRILSELLQTV